MREKNGWLDNVWRDHPVATTTPANLGHLHLILVTPYSVSDC